MAGRRLPTLGVQQAGKVFKAQVEVFMGRDIATKYKVVYRPNVKGEPKEQRRDPTRRKFRFCR